MLFYNAARAILVLVGGGCLITSMLGLFKGNRESRGANTALLLIAAALSIPSYFRWGELHDYGYLGRHFYHYHEIFHYYLGAKYFPELGYTRLYDCGYSALVDLGREGVKIPAIRDIRSLENPFTYAPSEVVFKTRAEACRERFGEMRWRAFKGDLRAMLEVPWLDESWRHMFFDLGYNPPPSWAVIGHPLASVLPMSPGVLRALPFIDLALVLGVGSFLIYQCFGLYPLCAFLVFFGNNYLADYFWTGGSFFRQGWFFFLIAAVCALKAGQSRAAGAFFGLSASLRLFPVAFALGALLPTRKKNVKPARELVVGAAAAFLPMLLISLAAWGIPRWGEFFAKIIRHSKTFFVMHMGFDKIAVFTRDIGNRDFFLGPGLGRFQEWQWMLRGRYQAHALLFGTVKVAALAATIGACFRAPPPVAAILFAWSALFFFSLPANYYYAFLALLPVVLYRPDAGPREAFRVAAATLLVASFPIMPELTPDAIVYNAYLNWAVFLGLVAIVASYYELPVPVTALVPRASRRRT